MKRDSLDEICQRVSRQANSLYPQLGLMFIPHEAGAFREIVTTREFGIIRHPASAVARLMLDKNSAREASSFIGMAVHHQVKWLGLASSEDFLALFNINLDEVTTARDAQKLVYHLLWHAIDLFEVRQKPEYAAKFREGPMVPKRSPMNMARLNLQSDIFAGLMCAHHGEEKVFDKIAARRANDSLLAISSRRAEDYPFVIALEASKYALQELMQMEPESDKYIQYARQLTIEVSQAFDDKAIRDWWSYSEPAQDMAWRNFQPDYILGCAIATSENPHIRATGHLIAELTGLEALSGLKIGPSYNAFAINEQNNLLHREIVERTFHDVVARGVQEESGYPLLLAAHQQNEGLLDGNVLGWCANALQAAAKAFDKALSNGASPMHAAKMEFEGTRDKPDWKALKHIGDTVIDEKRKGAAVTLGDLAEFCKADEALSPLLTSVNATRADADFMKKFQPEIGLPGLAPTIAPVTPAPKAAPAMPQYVSAPAPMGLSLGGGGARRVQTVPRKTENADGDSNAAV